MKTAEIAQRYLDFFEKNDHVIVPSASLVSDDPSLLFTVAGMVPMIPYLTGVVPAPHPRIADVQKCIRTNDIEEVGRTARHGTFFQMLGNWSFGDYFKEGAIRYAWELLTSSEADGGYGFDEKDLWVTVYETDDEAEAIWRDIIGLKPERIQRLGRADNYWNTGQPGPGGPDSEIFFDRGPAFGKDGGPAADDSRFLEIWNLVFMQDFIENIRSKTEFDIVGELPMKNIDTGMGLERVAFLKQGVDNMYETDQVRPVLDRAVELSGRRYGASHEDDVRFRVIADHVRSSLMLLSDGVRPSNEGRGYILRRLMRRTVRAMRLLGVDEPVFPELFATSRDAMKSAYPVLEKDWSTLSASAVAEEETFRRTLVSGSTILDLALDQTKKGGGTTLSGPEAFLLHDTYGFPIDLTLEVAEEAGLDVDRAAFDSLMHEQRQRAKADARNRKRQLADVSVYRDLRALGETGFDGYTALEVESRILGLLVDGAVVRSASEGQIAEVVLAETTLYAESGGQVADKGTIVGPGFELEVLDVQRPVPGLISHTVEVTRGTVAVDDAATTVVDAANRRAARQAHSATHLVHAALRDTLGNTATQAGSLNRMRLHALRLLVVAGAVDRDALGDRGDHEPRRAGCPRGHHAHRVSRRGEGGRSDGSLRREVRRRGAHGRHRRPVVPRALRRHARQLQRRDRSGQCRRRILRRRIQPSYRSPRRCGRVPRAGGGTGARVAAHRVVEDAPRTAAGADRRSRVKPQGRREAHRAVRG